MARLVKNAWRVLGLACLFSANHTLAATDERAVTAAMRVANDSPECRAIEPFYWEIGDRDRVRVSGAEGRGAPDAHTHMPIASATKWMFAAYVAEKRQGRLTPADISALTMQSGYTSFRHASCIRALPARRRTQTVAECFDHENNAHYEAKNEGRFFYNGGHFQHLAVASLGLGGMNNEALAAEFQKMLALPAQPGFGSPQLGGGINTSAADYAVFQRALLKKDLWLGSLLGSHAVCAAPTQCRNAIYTPVPSQWRWHYSLGHWVESDPATGDGAFSSAGAFGFYPWIDRQQRFYGVIARKEVAKKSGFASVECGRRIRSAFLGALSP